MPELTDDLLRLTVPCDARAPMVVRNALTRKADVGSTLGDVVLIASELVTNAVLHSGGSEDEAIEVRVSVCSRRLLISVRDVGRSGQSARLRPDQAVGGWGMQIVEQLAERWGSERDQGQHHVWAEVTLSSQR